MNCTTLFIDKGGIRKNIPGFSDFFSVSELGFWGEYSFLDFALYNIKSENVFFICEKEIRKNINSTLLKWDEKNYDFFPYKSDIDSVKDFLNSIEDDVLIIYDINFAAAAAEDGITKAVNDFVENKSVLIEKLSINSIPVDIYITDKKILIEQIDSMRNRMPSGTAVFDYITDEILATGFERIRDIDGDVLFNSTVKQIYKSNISLVEGGSSEIMESFMQNTPAPIEKESSIGKKGEVKNSIISSNSKIEGYVENSVIFSGVTVKPDTIIKNSVIMNGNQIGKNVNIENVLILPNNKQTGSNSNIQDKSIIGGKSSKVKNKDYPDQINSGITVVGMNSTIPAKFVAEPGSLIGADILLSRLKEIKKIKKSGSVV